jgi:hypothetical protein
LTEKFTEIGEIKDITEPGTPPIEGLPFLSKWIASREIT